MTWRTRETESANLHSGRISGVITSRRKRGLRWAVLIAVIVVSGVAFAAGASLAQKPNPFQWEAGHFSSALNAGVLIFREGLECVLVLAAITAGSDRQYQNAIAIGVAMGVLITAATWMVVVRILADLGNSVSALSVQAGTGLLAILVLLVVMNWFFHKTYWTGWISLHTNRKRKLLENEQLGNGKAGLWWGMAALGFTSFYREGFEVVLFLQSYRLKSGNGVVLDGLFLGGLCTVTVALLTFLVQQHLPYKKMLIVTGVLLGFVLLVMVGEEAQEMQLARWLPTTHIAALSKLIPGWMGLWFSIFPTAETLAAQALAGILVLGSYFTARSLARG